MVWNCACDDNERMRAACDFEAYEKIVWNRAITI